MMFFSENGLSTQKLEELQIGPISFREEAIFRREIRLEDKITVDVDVSTCNTKLQPLESSGTILLKRMEALRRLSTLTLHG